MKNLILFILSICFLNAFSQENYPVGQYEKAFLQNGNIVSKVITNPLRNPEKSTVINENYLATDYSINSSLIRWNTTQTYAIGYDATMSGDGSVGYCGWALNEEHISAYGNTNSTPFWEYTTSTSTDRNYVSASDTGIVAVGSYHNIYLFNKYSGTPLLNFDLTTLPDTGVAGPVDIISNGGFFIGTAYRNDTSTVLGFNKSSNIPVWNLRIPSRLYGVRISGNDSLAIVNTYYNYWVVNTFTGAIRYKDTITNGTQMTMGISGNGEYIATVNYRGYVKVYHWSGTAYVLLWQYQEAPGTYYNWITSVDISNDGVYMATGSLIFGSSSYDGKLRFFKIANGNTPIWTLSDIGDEIAWLEFSRNGNILAAVSYGDIADTKNDLLIFKTSAMSSTPLFSANMIGSPYSCSISNDGTSVIASGKLVHARAMGYGGTCYNVYVDTSSGPNNISHIIGDIPNSYELEQNYPNPFNPNTSINFQIKDSRFVTLKIYDLLGKEVETLVNENLQPGYYKINWNASQYPSGVYICRLVSGDYSKTIKLSLIK